MRIAMLGLKGIPATYGGVERYTEETAVRLAARGHTVFVYCRSYYTPRELARKPYHGVHLVRLPSLRGRATDTLSHSLLSTLDVLRRRVDVVIYHSLGNALFTAVPRLANIPTALVLHGQEWREDKWKGAPQLFFQLSERASFSLASRVCVIAEWLENDLRARHRHDSTNVSTGVAVREVGPVDYVRDLGLSPNNYLLFAGRLVPEKNLHVLLEAYNRLQTTMPLVVVGESQHEGQYVKQLHALAGPNVRFLGYRYGAELGSLYSNAYLYILPSAAEGVALTLLEALTFNNCVVVSDIPQNLEVVGSLGFSFRTGDAESLADLLRHLLAHPELVAERRAPAREHVLRRYSWDTVADRYEQVCMDMLGRLPEVADRSRAREIQLVASKVPLDRQ